MRKECNGASCIPMLGELPKFLPKSIGNKLCKSDTFLVALEIPLRNPHQNCLYLEQDASK